MNQHGHFAFGVDARHLGVLGAIAERRVIRNHDQIEIQILFKRSDLRFGAEHTQRTGVQRESSGRRAHRLDSRGAVIEMKWNYRTSDLPEMQRL